MPDIVKAIKEAPNSMWSEPGASEKDILFTEKSWGFSFSPEFKIYLKSFEYAEIGGVAEFVGLGPNVSKSQNAGAINKYLLINLSGTDFDKGKKNIKGKYCIGWTSDRLCLMQDKSGTIYGFNGENGDITKISKSMEKFIIDNYDKASKYVKPKPAMFETPKEPKKDKLTDLINRSLFLSKK